MIAFNGQGSVPIKAILDKLLLSQLSTQAAQKVQPAAEKSTTGKPC
jgi:hypothetical protein